MGKIIFTNIVKFYSKRFIPSDLKGERVSVHGLIIGIHAIQFFYGYKIHNLKIMEHLQLYEARKDEVQMNYLREYVQSVWGKNANIDSYEINPELNGEVLLRVKLMVI